jgi:hypothetical protein
VGVVVVMAGHKCLSVGRLLALAGWVRQDGQAS